MSPIEILALPIGENDAGANTVREYLTKLLTTVWVEGEGFSGKRAFGNSDWQDVIYNALTQNGVVRTSDMRAWDNLMVEVIQEMCGLQHNAKNESMTDLESNPDTPRDFAFALAWLKAGKRVARAGWNGKGIFVFLVPGSTFQVNRPPLLGIYPEGTTIRYHAHIDMKTADNMVVPWLASQTDILAEDWEVVADMVADE